MTFEDYSRSFGWSAVCVWEKEREKELLEDKHRRGDKASGCKRNHLLSSLPNFNPTLSSWPSIMSDIQEGALDMDRQALVIVYILTQILYMDTHSHWDTEIRRSG